jgi:hypothetical protein
LQHPHILPLHDSDAAAAVLRDAYVDGGRSDTGWNARDSADYGRGSDHLRGRQRMLDAAHWVAAWCTVTLPPENILLRDGAHWSRTSGSRSR